MAWATLRGPPGRYFFTHSMKSIAPILLALIAITLTGCGPKRIDGSSEEAFKKSLEAMSKSLTEDEQKALANGIMVVAFDGTNIFQMGAAPDLVAQRVRTTLNGKTFAEIMVKVKETEQARAAAEAAEKAEQEKREAAAKAERERQEAAAKAERKKEIENELAELTAEKAKAAADAEALKKFAVQRSRFYFTDGGFRQEGIIELTVNNGLSVPVSRAYFKAKLTSPGRSIPWVEADFNYTIPGGLEPKEAATWKLSPNMFSEWAKAPKDRADLVLVAELVRLNGADGKPLYDSDFSERKQKRAETLQATLAKGDY